MMQQLDLRSTSATKSVSQTVNKIVKFVVAVFYVWLPHDFYFYCVFLCSLTFTDHAICLPHMTRPFSPLFYHTVNEWTNERVEWTFQAVNFYWVGNTEICTFRGVKLFQMFPHDFIVYMTEEKSDDDDGLFNFKISILQRCYLPSCWVAAYAIKTFVRSS